MSREPFRCKGRNTQFRCLQDPIVSWDFWPCREGSSLQDTGSMTQNNEELPRSRWHDSLESLTKQHEGSDVTIELLSLDSGGQYEAEKVPFAYIEYDGRDDSASVAVGGSGSRFPVVLRHVIEHPQRILISATASSGGSAVDVIGADGVQTLITLHRRPALPK